jgi:hypothetical protein
MLLFCGAISRWCFQRNNAIWMDHCVGTARGNSSWLPRDKKGDIICNLWKQSDGVSAEMKVIVRK